MPPGVDLDTSIAEAEDRIETATMRLIREYAKGDDRRHRSRPRHHAGS